MTRYLVRAFVSPVVALLVIAASLAGCGGGGQPSCTRYSLKSSLYLVVRGPGMALEARHACSRLSGNNFSVTFGRGWSTTKGAHDYSSGTLACALRGTYNAEIDIYDSRSDTGGQKICATLRRHGFSRVRT
jgi:hypothetical protein